jgi:hypothetical protein
MYIFPFLLNACLPDADYFSEMDECRNNKQSQEIGKKDNHSPEKV